VLALYMPPLRWGKLEKDVDFRRLDDSRTSLVPDLVAEARDRSATFNCTFYDRTQLPSPDRTG
jgi:hypothetical protein